MLGSEYQKTFRLSPFSQTRVVVLWEEGNDQNLFEIDEVSISRREPKRVEGKAGFMFDNTGPATWAFISVEPA